MANPIFDSRKFQRQFKKASEELAQANGLLGKDSILRDMQDQPLEFGAASTNAIAHALTSAYLAYEYPTAVATLLGSAREYRSYWLDPKRPPAWDTFKDLYNNQVGRNIAEYAKRNNLSRDQMQDLILDALSSGKLIVTQNDPRIDPSFSGNPLSYSTPRGAGAPWTTPSAGFSEFVPSVTRVPVAPHRQAERTPPSSGTMGTVQRQQAANSSPDLVFETGGAPAPFVNFESTPAAGQQTSFDNRFNSLRMSPPVVPASWLSSSPQQGLISRIMELDQSQKLAEKPPGFVFESGTEPVPFVPDDGEGSFADRFGDRPPLRRLSSRFDRR